MKMFDLLVIPLQALQLCGVAILFCFDAYSFQANPKEFHSHPSWLSSSSLPA